MRKTIRIIFTILIMVAILGIYTNVCATSAASSDTSSEASSDESSTTSSDASSDGSSEGSSDGSSSSQAPEETAETVTISENAITIKVDETKVLTAESSDDEATITWESDKDTVATVVNGTVRGISPGVAKITAKGKTATATCTVTVEAKEVTTVTGSDFSKAKANVSKDGRFNIAVSITGATINESSDYYAMITETNVKPTIPGDLLVTNSVYSLLKDKNSTTTLNLVISEEVMDKMVSNKDMYLWVIEKPEYKVNADNTPKFVNFSSDTGAVKLNRVADPIYADAFFATDMTYYSDQIILNFISTSNKQRNMQIKIGKITDKAILQKIKDQNATGFSDLMKFAKSDKSFYNKTSTINVKSFGIEYTAGSGDSSNLPVIDIGKNLVDDAYYYLYVKMDDENGKYISQEAVTLGQSSVHDDGKWYIFFYGDDDFKWGDLSGAATDGTQMPGTLPQTGQAILIPISVVAAISVGIFFAKKYKKYEF